MHRFVGNMPGFCSSSDSLKLFHLLVKVQCPEEMCSRGLSYAALLAGRKGSCDNKGGNKMEKERDPDANYLAKHTKYHSKRNPDTARFYLP